MRITTGRIRIIIIIAGLLIAPHPIRAAFDPKGLPSDLRWVSVKGIPMVYSDQGQGDPLVVLSPYPFSTRLWTELTNRLASSARVIVVEPPGLRAPSSMDGDFSAIHLLYIYRDFIKALGLTNIHIMGVGEAGGLAAGFGHHFPEITTSIISINGFESASWSEKFEKTMNYFKSSTEGGLSKLLSAGSVRYREKPLSGEEMNQYLVPLQEEEQRNAFRVRYQAHADDIKAGVILAMLPNVNRPVLIIRSKSDELLTEDYIERTRSQIRKAPIQYQVIPQAGHFAFLDQPEKVAELVRTFLSTHPISKRAPRTD